jgi:hypothetical protein
MVKIYFFCLAYSLLGSASRSHARKKVQGLLRPNGFISYGVTATPINGLKQANDLVCKYRSVDCHWNKN